VPTVAIEAIVSDALPNFLLNQNASDGLLILHVIADEYIVSLFDVHDTGEAI